MSDEFDLSAPELTSEDLLVLEDPYFHADTVAIVTGAASGIGRATAVGLAANDLTVVGADIDTEGLDETDALIEEMDLPGTFHGVETDLTDDGDVEQMVETLSNAGLDGIEVWYPYGSETSDEYADITVEDAAALADRYDLLKTGGSDCHGPESGKFRLGEVQIPADALAALEERAA